MVAGGGETRVVECMKNERGFKTQADWSVLSESACAVDGIKGATGKERK